MARFLRIPVLTYFISHAPLRFSEATILDFGLT